MHFIKKPLAAAAFALALIGNAGASVLLVDRGLPDENLNNGAGANRSNVAWAFGGYTPTDYWLVGDTFTNSSAQAWNITTLRVWTTTPIDTAKLWGSDGNTAAGIISTATYADGITTYQGSSGVYRDMRQIDFAVNLTLGAGETFTFYFDGTGNNNPATIVPFVHASNAALGGAPADGADNLMWAAHTDGSTILETESWTSLGNGWDKASDVNVQVFGNAIPEPGSVALVGVALLGGFVARRRKA